MAHLQIILVASILSFWVFACSESEEESDAEPRVVVEAFLTDGKPLALKLSRELSFSVGNTIALNDLRPVIREGDKSYQLEHQGDGLYTSDAVEVVSGHTYQLALTIRDTEISASTVVPPKPTNFKLSSSSIVIEPFNLGGGGLGSFPTIPDPIEAKWNNSEGEYHMVVVTCMETNPVLINDDEEAPERPSFRNEPNTGNSHEIQAFDFQYYGKHAVILYKLRPEYAALYGENGNTSVNLKTPYSNVTNALGIFTGLNADTLFVTVKKQ